MATKKNKGIKGIKEVLTNLNKAMQKMEQSSLKGLIECAIAVRYDMAKTSPKVPVDLRNLEQSWYIVTATQNISTPAFSGEDAGIIEADHRTAMSEAKAITEI